jgi:hypothetical protein
LASALLAVQLAAAALAARWCIDQRVARVPNAHHLVYSRMFSAESNPYLREAQPS